MIEQLERNLYDWLTYILQAWLEFSQGFVVSSIEAGMGRYTSEGGLSLVVILIHVLSMFIRT
jgi:hypothetical protein